MSAEGKTAQPSTTLPVQQTIPAQPHPCPNCGHCPTCGKSKAPTWPYGAPYWYYQNPYVTWSTSPQFISQSQSGLAQGQKFFNVNAAA